MTTSIPRTVRMLADEPSGSRIEREGEFWPPPSFDGERSRKVEQAISHLNGVDWW